MPSLLPDQVNTLLPLIEACDNFKLPSGPWTAKDCKNRLDEHTRLNSTRYTSVGVGASGAGGDSAIDDEEEEDQEEARRSPTQPNSFANTTTSEPALLPTKETLDAEFLVPFFVSVPKDSITPLSRRSSNHLRLTPLAPISSHRSTTPSTSTSSVSTTIDQPIGFLRPSIVQALLEDNEKMLSLNCRPVWSFLPPTSTESHVPTIVRSASMSSGSSRTQSRRNSESRQSGTPPVALNTTLPGGDGLREMLQGLRSRNSPGGYGIYAVGFQPWVNEEEGYASRREHMDRIVRGWKENGEFKDQLGGWRDEEYTIYGPATGSSHSLPGTNAVFSLERAACALFGLVTFGVHLTAYTKADDAGEEMKIWVPRRSATKPTWPSYLDNTVAGGITAGATPFESIVRECEEEASFDATAIKNIRSTGIVSYCYRTKDGWIQPEVQYVYDLALPTPIVLFPDFDSMSSTDSTLVLSPNTDEKSFLPVIDYSPNSIVPRPNPLDNEVASFHLLPLSQCVELALAGHFKPNCAIVLVDFAIRHGEVTFETDRRYAELCRRMKSDLGGLPGPL